MTSHAINHTLVVQIFASSAIAPNNLAANVPRFTRLHRAELVPDFKSWFHTLFGDRSNGRPTVPANQIAFSHDYIGKEWLDSTRAPADCRDDARSIVILEARYQIRAFVSQRIIPQHS